MSSVRELFNSPTLFMVIFLVIMLPLLVWALVTFFSVFKSFTSYTGQVEEYIVNVTNSSYNSIVNITETGRTVSSMANFLASLLANRIFLIVLIAVGIIVWIFITVKSGLGGGYGYGY